MADKRLLLIDGNSLLYKAFYALPVERFTNQNGFHTNAIYGFNVMLNTMLKEVQPTKALAAFDAGKITFRTKMYSEYKGNRKKTPSELLEQFDKAKDLLKYRGIKSYQIKNYEADDIIGTLSKYAEQKNYKVTIVTGDRDLTQLCSDNTTVSISKTGVSNVEHYNTKHVRKKFNITPHQIIDMKGLKGDTSDNYPGISGVGTKTAIKLLHKFNTIDGIYNNLDQINGKKLKEHLINDKNKAQRAKVLATIKRDVPLGIKLSELTYDGDNDKELIKFYKQLNFQRFLGQMHLNLKETINYHELTRDTLNKLQFSNHPISFYLAMDGDNYHVAPFIGFVIGQDNKYWVSKDIKLLKNKKIKSILENNNIVKDVFDAKRLYVGLNRLNITLSNIDFDMLLVSYLLNTNDNSNDLGKVAHNHHFYNIQTDEDVYGKGAKRSIPDNKNLFNHLTRKAIAIENLKQEMFNGLDKHQQMNLYRNIELPITFVLARMEIAGITVNTNQLNSMKNKYERQLNDIKQKIYNDAGEEFNISSPKQLGKILFEKLRLPVLKKTKTGYSTAVGVLEKLAPNSEIVRNVLQYRSISKILSTYVEGLLKDIYDNDNKVHTRYLQTLTQTGRLSSVDPNLQNIPVRTNEGRKIRKAFVPSHKDWVIFSSDYSQIELRVLASISKDENMEQEFKNNDDIHASTARRIFDLNSNNEVTPDLRRQAKAVNFGIVYGISDFGLSKNVGISRKRAKLFIKKYFNEYPNVKKYMDNKIDFAHKNGYVETITHRRRYLPDIHSKNFHQRSFAERTAMNTPIQGSAADIIKIAMINMEKAIKNMKSTMLLQIHDELIFEAPKSEINKLKKIVPEIMDSAKKLNVPLKVNSKYGQTWYDF